MRVSKEEKAKFVRLYKEPGTYAAVARACGRSASTVARYIKEAQITITIYR